MKTRSLLLIPLAVALLGGCGSGKKADEVAATVNGKTITYSDVQKVARNFKRQGMPPDPTTQGTTEEEKLYYTAVNRLAEQQILIKEAESAGLAVSPEELAQGIEELKGMAGGDEGLNQLIAEQGITMADIERDMQTNLLLRAYLEKIRTEAPPIPEEELRAYFDEHPEVFGAKPEVRARHILVMVDASAPEAERAQARQKIETALKRAKAGEPFDKLASEYSQDPGSAQQGGDLGWFGRGRMVAPFDSAAFALSPGQLSGIVETQFGYHVIKLEETRSGQGMEYEPIKERIREVLTRERSQSLFRENLDSLKSKATMEIQPPTPAILDSLKV